MKWLGQAVAPDGLGIDESTMHGDHYSLKSLMALPRGAGHA